MNERESRWALPDLQSAVDWCSRRNAQNIRCIIDVLGEYAREESQAAGSVEAYMAAAKSIADKWTRCIVNRQAERVGGPL